MNREDSVDDIAVSAEDDFSPKEQNSLNEEIEAERASLIEAEHENELSSSFLFNHHNSKSDPYDKNDQWLDDAIDPENEAQEVAGRSSLPQGSQISAEQSFFGRNGRISTIRPEARNSTFEGSEPRSGASFNPSTARDTSLSTVTRPRDVFTFRVYNSEIDNPEAVVTGYEHIETIYKDFPTGIHFSLAFCLLWQLHLHPKSFMALYSGSELLLLCYFLFLVIVYSLLFSYFDSKIQHKSEIRGQGTNQAANELEYAEYYWIRLSMCIIAALVASGPPWC